MVGLVYDVCGFMEQFWTKILCIRGGRLQYYQFDNAKRKERQHCVGVWVRSSILIWSVYREFPISLPEIRITFWIWRFWENVRYKGRFLLWNLEWLIPNNQKLFDPILMITWLQFEKIFNRRTTLWIRPCQYLFCKRWIKLNSKPYWFLSSRTRLPVK